MIAQNHYNLVYMKKLMRLYCNQSQIEHVAKNFKLDKNSPMTKKNYIKKEAQKFGNYEKSSDEGFAEKSDMKFSVPCTYTEIITDKVNLGGKGESTLLKENTHMGGERSTEAPYVKGKDFLFTHLLSFPLHVPVDKNECNDVHESVQSKIHNFPSVSTVLSESMSPESRKLLEEWKQKSILQMGEDSFYAMQKATLNRGSKFHGSLRQYLEAEDPSEVTVDKDVEGCWESVSTILSMISDVKTVEKNVFHPVLQYKGIVDCVASYKDTPHVIEWKQSEKSKKTLAATYDAPVQLCAYMGALNWCKEMNSSAPVTNGLVVVAYVDGSPADAFPMDLNFCNSYWMKWLHRLQKYWLRRSHSELM